MVEKIILDNGVRVLHEKLEHVRSCALGVWVKTAAATSPTVWPASLTTLST